MDSSAFLLLGKRPVSHVSLLLFFRYSVLKIKQGATKADVSTAFRKEMLKHHPDIQTGVSEAEKARAVERSKYITEAYRKIKTEMKR